MQWARPLPPVEPIDGHIFRSIVIVGNVNRCVCSFPYALFRQEYIPCWSTSVESCCHGQWLSIDKRPDRLRSAVPIDRKERFSVCCVRSTVGIFDILDNSYFNRLLVLQLIALGRCQLTGIAWAIALDQCRLIGIARTIILSQCQLIGIVWAIASE